MFKPELFAKSNAVSKKDALECLQKFAPKWIEKCRVLDLGCGDGSLTTEVLRACLPPSFSQLVGADVGPAMVDHANAHYGDQRTKFIKLDMAGNIPQELVASFDYVFSSYAIHWAQEQKETFSNIYTLLVEGGSCLLLFVGYHQVYDFYRILVKQPKWQHWLKDAERCYISPYQDVEEPDKEVYKIMENIKFKDIQVKYEIKSCFYEEVHFKNLMLVLVSPMKIPAEIEQDFANDCMQAAKDLKIVEPLGGKHFVKIGYTLITAMVKEATNLKIVEPVGESILSRPSFTDIATKLLES